MMRSLPVLVKSFRRKISRLESKLLRLEHELLCLRQEIIRLKLSDDPNLKKYIQNLKKSDIFPSLPFGN